MSRWVVLFVAAFLLINVQISAAQENSPTSTPPNTMTYVVQHGDTLGLIASRNHTTVTELVHLNNLLDPQLIVLGQRLRVPVPGNASPTPPAINAAITPTDPLSLDSTPGTDVPGDLSAQALSIPIVSPAFDYGIELEFDGQDANTIASQITILGMHWAKVEANWRDIEATRAVIDYTELDAIVEALHSRNLNILMTISTAPDWTRSAQIENGPPDDLSQFTQFARALAEHYAGRVQAYEIWNEPNLRREWNSSLYPVSAEAYAALLRNTYAVIKTVDPRAIVVSAGLAPTGFNDGINAIDDRVYLNDLYAQGLAQFSDAIGAHPYGYANPPDATCCAAPEGVISHYGHPSFYFLDTLNDYRMIMLNYGDQNTLIWVTRFGWGTSMGTSAPQRNTEYVSYTSLDQQAQYLARGFELGAKLEFVGVMIVYNLNACAAHPANTEACYYSMLDPSGQARPVYNTLEMIFANAITR